MEKIISQIEESIKVKRSLLNLKEKIIKATELLTDCLGQGNKILIAGNGGSAADAQHFAGEIIGRFKKERKALSVIALSTNSSVLTAVANDYGFENVFSRQVEGLGKRGDVFFAISTSGCSLNILKALKTAKNKGLKTIGLTGRGEKMKEFCDVLINVDSGNTPGIQESHILIIHILCDFIEESLFNNETGTN